MSNEPIPSPKRVAQNEAAKQAVILAFTVATIAVMLALSRPDALKTARMRAAVLAATLLDSLSRNAGFVCMTLEMATGIREYTVPYHLSLLRDMASRKYRKDSNAGAGD